MRQIQVGSQRVGADGVERKTMCIYSVKRFFAESYKYSWNAMSLIHNSFKGLIMMEENREPERSFKVKGHFQIQKSYPVILESSTRRDNVKDMPRKASQAGAGSGEVHLEGSRDTQTETRGKRASLGVDVGNLWSLGEATGHKL